MATVTISLAEGTAKLRQVQRALLGPGPLANPLAHARRADVWQGTVAQWFVSELSTKDGFLKHRLAPALDVVAAWAERRVKELEDYDRAVAAGTAALGPAPAGPLKTGGPGSFPDYAPYRGPVQGFSGMDPAGVRQLITLLGRAADEIYAHGRVADTFVTEQASLLPPDVVEAIGRQAFLRLKTWLGGAIADLNARAGQGEIANAAGALLTGAVPVLQEAAKKAAELAATPAPQVPLEPPTDTVKEVAKAPVPEEPADPVASQEAAKKLADDYPAKKVLDDPKKLQELSKKLNDHPADPVFAAVFVHRFGPKNFVQVVRAMQAAEQGWEHASLDPDRNHRTAKGVRDPKNRPTDPIAVVAAFSQVLATATAGQHLSDQDEDDVVNTTDPLALSWLLHAPKEATFSADFLVKAFERHMPSLMQLEAHRRLSARFEPRLGGESGHLHDDGQVGLLRAIADNPEASLRVVNLKIKAWVPSADPPYQNIEVKNALDLLYGNGVFDDNGAALGELLNQAHRATATAEEGKELTRRLINAAGDHDGVQRAHEALRRIAHRDHWTPTEAKEAYAKLKDNPDHGGREGLLQQVRDDAECAAEFAAKMVTDKKLRDLMYETRGASDLLQDIPNPATLSPEQRAALPPEQLEAAWKLYDQAEALLESTIASVARGKELSDPARLGLALSIADKVDRFATAVKGKADAELHGKAGEPKEFSAQDIAVTTAELVGAMTEAMKNDDARRTLQLAAGSLAGSWADSVSDGYLAQLALGDTDPAQEVLDELGHRGDELGQFLCATTQGMAGAAKASAEEAIEALAGMRLGIDMFFEGVDIAKSFLPGGPIVGAGASWVEEKIRKPFDDHVESLEGAEWAKARRQTDAAHTMADRVVLDGLAFSLLNKAVAMGDPPIPEDLAKRDQLLAQLGVEATAPDRVSKLTGMDALKDAGLVDDSGRFVLPDPGSAAYSRYEHWLDWEAEQFASRIGVLADVPSGQFAGCIARDLQVESLR